MKKLITFSATLFIGMAALAQQMTEQQTKHFSRIHIKGNIEVEISNKKGSDTSKQRDFVVTDDGVLNLDSDNYKEGEKISINVQNVEELIVSERAVVKISDKLTTGKILISIHSGAKLYGRIETSSTVDLRADGDSEFNVRVEAQSLTTKFNDHAKVNLSGITRFFEMNLKDKAFCNARNLLAQTLVIAAEDEAVGLLFSQNNISISTFDNAKVSYFGIPNKIQLNENAVAIIKKRNLGNKKAILVANENLK